MINFKWAMELGYRNPEWKFGYYCKKPFSVAQETILS
jgi:hypothetical protein